MATEQPAQPRPTMTWPSVVLLMLFVLAGLGGGWWVFVRVVAPLLPQRIVPHPELHAGVGEPLSLLELEPLTGNPPRLSLTDIQGRVVLLNFWGTWCPPCRDELPHLDELRKRFAGQDVFQLAAISYPAAGQDDDLVSLREETADLLKRLNLDLPTYHDPGDMTRAALDQIIGFEGFPTSVLLDRRGVIRAVWIGYRPGVETEIERYVDKVLSETEEERQRQ